MQEFLIPETTLRRKTLTKNEKKISLGPGSQLSYEVKMKLVLHALKLQRAAFALSKRVVQRLAFQIATTMNKKTLCNKTKERAGKD